MSDWIDERRLEGEMGAANKPSEAAYGVGGRAAGEAALEHGMDGARVRRATDAFLLSRVARAALAAAHDPANFRDPREVSVNLGVAFDALDEAAQTGTPVGWNIWARKVLLRRFGGDRG